MQAPSLLSPCTTKQRLKGRQLCYLVSSYEVVLMLPKDLLKLRLYRINADTQQLVVFLELREVVALRGQAVPIDSFLVAVTRVIHRDTLFLDTVRDCFTRPSEIDGETWVRHCGSFNINYILIHITQLQSRDLLKVTACSHSFYLVGIVLITAMVAASFSIREAMDLFC